MKEYFIGEIFKNYSYPINSCDSDCDWLCDWKNWRGTKILDQCFKPVWFLYYLSGVDF